MNKQEAILKLKAESWEYEDNSFRTALVIDLDEAQEIISQIHEPQKVVVPKHIADKIEYCKDTEGYGLFHAMDYFYGYKDSAEWLECHEEAFVRAWSDGYEVEKEKLYHVHLTGIRYGDLGYDEEEGYYDFCNKKYTTKIRYELTEAEIKDTFPWAWQFAKEVE
ncbi:DUF1642 domain-containing protein [Streptococcus suis]|nr:DUF1642 domain-containing protein [Streptococcus suis]